MILSDIKSYLQQRGQASLGDIALHFKADPEAVRGMLDVWVRKGKVIKQASTTPSCGSSCQQCGPETIEIYAWTKKDVVVKLA